jgi:phenylacetate-CoA ligase
VSHNRVLMMTGLGDLANARQYGRAVRRVQEVMQCDPPALRRFQEQRLRERVRHAYETVGLYRRKWSLAGVHPDDIRTLADLTKLPIVTKDDFRQCPAHDLLSTDFRARDCFVLSTSGSTGSPRHFYVDEGRAMIDFALSLPRYMAGRPPVSSASVVRDFLLRRRISFMAIVVPSEYLYHQMFWSMRHTVVDCLEPAEVHIRAINTKRPRYLSTYPSTLRNICIAAQEKGIRLHQPQVILLSGEVVDQPLRDLVRRTFGTDPLDVYGTTELGYVASECTRHEGMHLFTWKVMVELLGEDGREVPPGQSGRVVVTDLFTKATPIIRYDGLGDYAARKEEACSCGSPLPLLARVEGRRVDSIVLPDGRIVHPYSLTLALEDTPCLSKFQIRQEQPDHLRVLLVKAKIPGAEAVSFARDSHLGQEILRRFDKILKHQASVDLVTVDDIPVRPGSRKYPTVVSLAGAYPGTCFVTRSSEKPGGKAAGGKGPEACL